VHSQTLAWPASAEPLTSCACALTDKAENPAPTVNISVDNKWVTAGFFIEIINI
jgi:hypothetical protein